MMEIVSLMRQTEDMIEQDKRAFSTNNNDKAESIATLNSDIIDESILPMEHNEATA